MKRGAHLLRQELRYLFCALGYFTRVPIPAWVGYQADDLNHAARYFPLIGLLVGGAAAAALWLAQGLLPLRVAIVLSMLASVLLTGAFHEDGLADSVDGLWGGYQRADVLRIMHDSRIGSFGAIALLLAFLLKLELLAALPAAQLPALLIAAHAASRWLAISLLASLSYARPEGKAKPLATQLGWPMVALAGLWGGLPLALAGWRSAAFSLLALLLLRQGLCRYYRRRLGGYTGDLLGMAQQLAELLLYAVFLAAAPSGV